MMDLPHITTGGTVFNRTLGRVGLVAAVLLATVLVGGGSAVAAPAGAAPAMDAPNETAADYPGGLTGSSPPSGGLTAPAAGGPDTDGIPDPNAFRPVPAGADESVQMEVIEVTEEHIVVEARFPSDTFDGREFPSDTFEGTDVNIPDPQAFDELPAPDEVERIDERTYRMHFRTADIGLVYPPETSPELE